MKLQRLDQHDALKLFFHRLSLSFSLELNKVFYSLHCSKIFKRIPTPYCSLDGRPYRGILAISLKAIREFMTRVAFAHVHVQHLLGMHSHRERIGSSDTIVQILFPRLPTRIHVL